MMTTRQVNDADHSHSHDDEARSNQLIRLARTDVYTLIHLSSTHDRHLHRSYRPKLRGCTIRQADKDSDSSIKYLIELAQSIKPTNQTNTINISLTSESSASASKLHVDLSELLPSSSLTTFYGYVNQLFHRCYELIDYGQCQYHRSTLRILNSSIKLLPD